jgi:hypothetical protein
VLAGPENSDRKSRLLQLVGHRDLNPLPTRTLHALFLFRPLATKYKPHFLFAQIPCRSFNQ